MNEEGVVNFSKIMASIQKNQEQKEQLKSCKDLDSIYKFIKTAYPQYELSRDDLEECFVAITYAFENNQKEDLEPLKDEQMEISGGRKSEATESIKRWKERAQNLKKAATMGDMMSECLGMDFDNFDPGLIMRTVGAGVQKMFTSENTDRYTATNMMNTEGRINRVSRSVRDYSSRSSIYDSGRIGRLLNDSLSGREQQHNFKDLGQI